MAGNSKKPGAVRKPGSKKGAIVGSGGQRRRGLEGKGPTPKAEDRSWHPAAKRKAMLDKLKQKQEQLEASRNRVSARVRALNIPVEHEIICGRNPVREAIASGLDPLRVFITNGLIGDSRVEEVIRTATALGAPIVELTRSDLDYLTDESVHQGVAIEVGAYEYCQALDLLEKPVREGRKPLIVALDGVTDPHNLGAVLRSGSAFSIDGVLLPTRRSASVNMTVWKVSAGAACRVKVARETNLVNALEKLKKSGCFIVGLDANADCTVSEMNLATESLVLVTGAEGKGISRLVREHCDLIVSIPISSSMESLNAAVATGIALYEIDRLRSA